MFTQTLDTTRAPAPAGLLVYPRAPEPRTPRLLAGGRPASFPDLSGNYAVTYGEPDGLRALRSAIASPRRRKTAASMPPSPRRDTPGTHPRPPRPQAPRESFLYLRYRKPPPASETSQRQLYLGDRTPPPAASAYQMQIYLRYGSPPGLCAVRGRSTSTRRSSVSRAQDRQTHARGTRSPAHTPKCQRTGGGAPSQQGFSVSWFARHARLRGGCATSAQELKAPPSNARSFRRETGTSHAEQRGGAQRSEVGR